MHHNVHIESEHLYCHCDQCTAGMSFGVAKAIRFVLFLIVCALAGVVGDIAYKLIFLDGIHVYVNAGWLHWLLIAIGPLLGWWFGRLSRHF